MIRLQKKFTNTKHKWFSLLISIAILIAITGCGNSSESDDAVTDYLFSEIEDEITENVIEDEQDEIEPSSEDNSLNNNLGTVFSISNVPEYSDDLYVPVNNNIPYFERDDLAAAAESFEHYSKLDALGRCGVVYASIGIDIMPAEDREGIGQIKPTGWHTVKYDIVDGKYLYNRCHLIGFQLSGENANEKNLITGTRYMNKEGMLPFENMVADYVKETENHVLYRVTPVFDGDNLLATGVLMEAESVEDQGEDILFCIFVYNVQPGITIDYATGESRQDASSLAENESVLPDQISESVQIETPVQSQTPVGADYILNTNTKKFHYTYCGSVNQMSEKNKQPYSGGRDDIIAMGYEPCKNCNP